MQKSLCQIHHVGIEFFSDRIFMYLLYLPNLTGERW